MRLLALACAFLLAGVAPAAAEPISAAIIGVLGLTGLAASAATIAVPIVATVGISLGLSALNKAMAKKPQAGDTVTGVETNVQLGGDIARQVPIGIVGAKGHLVYHNSAGSIANDLYQQVYVLADWVCDGLAGVFVNGKACTLTGGPVDFGISEYPGLIALRFYDGTQTVADADLISNARPAGKWTSNSKLTGMCYVYVRFNYLEGAPLYDQGIPTLTFSLRGAKLYDPRLDSTNGGSGSQRWADPATWAFSQNPAIAALNYLLGFYRNGELLLGMGVPAADVLRDTVFAAANACDEAVTLEAGGSEARYRAGCFLTADNAVTHAQHLEVLLSTMAGYLYDYSGYYFLQAGVGQTAASTVTDNDLVTGSPVTLTAKRSRGELVNRIHGQFLNGPDEYQPASYTPQISVAGVSEDYQELGTQLDLLSVPSQWQAERIAQIRLREVRRQATASITVGFNYLPLQAGDWITWNSGRYGNRTFRIVNKLVDPVHQTLTLDLAETNANVYSWTATDDQGNPVTVGIAIQGAALITQPAAFTVQAVTLADTAGNQAPGLKFGWTPINDPTVDAVVIEWRKVGTTAATRASDPSVADGVFQTTDGIVGGTNYEARATITTTPSRITTWTAWIAVTTTATFFNLASAVDTASDIPTGLALSSHAETLPTGETTTVLNADWNVAAGDPKTTYEIEIKDGPDPLSLGNFISFPTATNHYTWRGLPQGRAVVARVRSITGMGTQSGWSPEVAHTVLGDTVPPAAATGFGVSASFQTIFLSWTNPADKDLSHIEIWESTTNNRAAATLITRVKAPGTTYTRVGLSPGATRFYWIRTVDTSGNLGPFTPNTTAGLAGTTLQIITADIAAAAIDQTKFANAMQPVGIIASTAAPHVTGIDTALNTADGKQYRWTGTAWTATIATVDLVGTVPIAQIPPIPSTNITGQMTDAQLAAIAAAKVTGQLADTQIAAVGATKVTGQLTNAQIAALDAAKLTGTVAIAQIPPIPATQVTGTFTDAQIASVSAAKITGQITSTQITDDAITAPKIAAGAVTASEIAANTITSGQIAANTITSGQIAANTITSGQIAANTITAGQIAANTLTAAEIAANAITASELAAGSVVAGKIAADAVTANEIAANSITSSEIAAGAVIAGKIAADAVTANEIAANSITSSEIAAGAVIAGKIAADAVTANEIAANAVTATELAAGSVIAGKIAVDAVTAGTIAANAVTAGKIATDAVTANTIAANAVTAGKIAANAVSTNELAANAVTAAKILADTITAAQIAAGAINASELAAKAVTADKLAVGTKNVAFNTDYNIGPSGFGGWTVENGSAGAFSAGTQGPAGFKIAQIAFSSSGYFSSRPMLPDGSLATGYAVTAGNYYEASACLAVSAGSATVQINWFDAGGSQINFIPGNAVSSNVSGGAWSDYPKSGVILQAPAGAAFARVYILISGSLTVHFSALVFQGAYAGQTELSPYTTPGITVIQGGNITTGSIVTTHMVANTILGDRILTDSLDANRVKANTVLASSVTVAGDPLGTIAARAADPAARINVGTSQIGPGFVLISGATSLASWRDGGDNTKIAGGSIQANTIDANRIRIGARGLDILGCQFQVTRSGGALTNDVTWTAGTITYLADNGISTPVNISAGGTTMAVGGCIFWQKGNSVFFYSGSPPSVQGGDNVIMMMYLGGGAMNVLYGGTIIDGTQITTRSLSANRVQANSITATELIQSEAIIVNNAMMANATVGTLTVLDGGISGVYAATGDVSSGTDVSTVAFSALAGRRFLVNFMGTDTSNAVRSGVNPASTIRQIVCYVQQAGVGNTEVGRSSSWDSATGFSGGVFQLFYPGIAGAVVYTAPASSSYLFFVRNFTGLNCNITLSVTELKR